MRRTTLTNVGSSHPLISALSVELRFQRLYRLKNGLFDRADATHLTFDDLHEVATYKMLHTSERRAHQDLELLFEAGLEARRSPISNDQLNVLDVGLGHGPCLYAAIDFLSATSD